MEALVYTANLEIRSVVYGTDGSRIRTHDA
jgi:hypothetical protein